MASYGASKERLFFEYSSKNQIINIDDSFGEKLARKWGKDAIVISIEADRASDDRRFVFVRSIKKESFGSRIRINSSWGDAELYIPLIGDFNISNAIQVLAFLFITNIEFKMACDAIENMTEPPGRIQYVKESSADTAPDIFIDYAHTPAALESALKALRPHTIKNLWCIFGCGGDRDQGKRKMMGQVVDKLADRIVVTNDNPRYESPMNIIQDILKGIKSNNVISIENRRDAIAHSITEAHHDDLILISGKGHENYQLIGSNRIVFSDYKCVVTNLGNRLQGVNI
jgi:UDP-N-acetylmuramoyl-L-alanyl-D-glutamate--2,6-diaminopimelate ligase